MIVLYIPGIIVRCGSTGVQLCDPFYTERVALACAADHAWAHGCTPWLEYPLPAEQD